jgi:hypothetical protein
MLKVIALYAECNYDGCSTTMVNVVMLSVMAPIFVVTNEEKSRFVPKLFHPNGHPGKPY